MKYSDERHREQFLGLSGYGHLLQNSEMPGRHLLRYFFESEDHTKSVFTLAKFITKLSESSSATLVILDKMFIWRSGRDEYLITTVFQSLIDQKVDQPSDRGMLLWSSTEVDGATSLYHLALLFGWDAYIYPDSGDVSAFISHDGFVEVRTNFDPLRFSEFIEEETTRKFLIVDQ